jgi:hypothetical protein
MRGLGQKRGFGRRDGCFRILARMTAGSVLICGLAATAAATDLAPSLPNGAMAPAGLPMIIHPVPPVPPAAQALPRRPACIIVPQPQMNLYGEDVMRDRPTRVCVSRGLYADRMPPDPPPPRPWWWGW